MSVTLESTSVLVPVERIEEEWSGGLAGYERDAPAGRFDCDGELARIAFSSNREAQSFARDLERSGFRFEFPTGATSQLSRRTVRASRTAPGSSWRSTGMATLGKPA